MCCPRLPVSAVAVFFAASESPQSTAAHSSSINFSSASAAASNVATNAGSVVPSGGAVASLCCCAVCRLLHLFLSEARFCFLFGASEVVRGDVCIPEGTQVVRCGCCGAVLRGADGADVSFLPFALGLGGKGSWKPCPAAHSTTGSGGTRAALTPSHRVLPRGRPLRPGGRSTRSPRRCRGQNQTSGSHPRGHWGGLRSYSHRNAPRGAMTEQKTNKPTDKQTAHEHHHETTHGSIRSQPQRRRSTAATSTYSTPAYTASRTDAPTADGNAATYAGSTAAYKPAQAGECDLSPRGGIRQRCHCRCSQEQQNKAFFARR